MSQNETKTPVKNKKKRVQYRPKTVHIENIHKKLLNALMKETQYLFELSHHGKLNREDSQSLVNYLKLLKDLQKLDEDLSENISEEELVKLALGKQRKQPKPQTAL